MIEIRNTWSALTNNYFQSLLALSFDILDIIAGIIVASFSYFLTTYPWIILLYPPALTVVGDVSGVFTGRLTTSLHLGTIKPGIKDNTDEYYRLQLSSIILALINIIIVSITSYFVAISLNINIPHLYSFLIISFLMVIIPSLFSIYLLTPLLGGVAYHRGLDPDILLYPVISTLSDIITSSFFIVIMIIYIFNESVLYVISIVLITILIIIYYYSHKGKWRWRDFIVEYRGGMIAISSLTVLSVFTGRILAELKGIIHRYPIILFIYPSLIKTIGDQGAIISSTTTTRLNLGSIPPSLKAIFTKDVFITVFAAVTAGLTVTLIYTGGATIYYNLGAFTTIFIVYILALHLLVTVPIVALTGIISIATFKYGLDPDNITIPSITTFSDFSTTILLVIMLSIVIF
jgi:mgtE-like transporter